MKYKVEPKAQNELKQAIAEKVQEAVLSGRTESLMHKRQSYKFARIKIDSKWLYYNLQNDRTLTKTREFVEENNKPDDYFSEQNFFNVGAIFSDISSFNESILKASIIIKKIFFIS